MVLDLRFCIASRSCRNLVIESWIKLCAAHRPCGFSLLTCWEALPSFAHASACAACMQTGRLLGVR
eukprot:6214371-Pleurochrysis_carterae.AAC.5